MESQLVCNILFSLTKFCFFIVISIIFILICCIIAFAFFDMSFVSKDIKAAVNNRGESLLLAVKIFLQYLYIFFGNINYHWLLIISMLIVSYTTFNQFKTTYAFFNDFTSMVYSVVNGVWLWSNVCLAIVKILENTEFTGGF